MYFQSLFVIFYLKQDSKYPTKGDIHGVILHKYKVENR